MSTDLFSAEYLKKLEYLELIARRLVFGRQQAQRLSVRKGASIEFKDYREYSPGDDPRTVDWSVYARLGEVVVKLYRQEEELDLWVLLDSSKSMKFGEPDKFDQARQIAGALAYIGMSNMDSASVMPFSDSLQEGRVRLRGRGQVFRLLEYLKQLNTSSTTNLQESARAFVARVRRPGLVTIISDFYGLEECQRAIDVLRFYGHEVYVIHVASPWELDPPIRGEYRLVDSESTNHADLVVTDSMLKRYKRKHDEFTESMRKYCMKNSIGSSLARTDVPFDEFITSMLRQGGLVA